MRSIRHIFLAALLLAPSGAAGNDACKVLAVLGAAAVSSDGEIYTEVKTGDIIKISDTLETAPWSKAKLLFSDGSLLTLEGASALSFDDYFFNGYEDTGSTLTLRAGSLRLATGSAEFQINSDVAWIDARNSVLELGLGFEEGNFFLTLICRRGMALVESSDASIEGKIFLRQGEIVTVWKGEALMPPISLTSSESMVSVIKPIKELVEEESVSTRETMEEIRRITALMKHGETGRETMPYFYGLPPLDQQPVNTAPVTVNLSFQ